MQTSAQHPSFAAPVCLDCTHYQQPLRVLPECHHPGAGITRDVVTGVVHGPACSDERRAGGRCGPDGARFEQRIERRRGWATRALPDAAGEPAATPTTNTTPPQSRG